MCSIHQKFATSNDTLQKNVLQITSTTRKGTFQLPRRKAELRIICETKKKDKVQFKVTTLKPGKPSEDIHSSGPDGRTVGKTLEALRSKDRAPKRWLGQHYMVNDEVTSKTVVAADINPGDLVLEIGPGTGALTQEILAAGAKVIAVEKDKDMISVCEKRFEGNKSVLVVNKDILQWPIRDVFEPILKKRREGRQGESFRAKVVSNLPFNITTEILQLLLPMGDVFSSVTLMLQDDAALRLMDPTPRTNDYRKMSLFVHFYSEPVYHFFVDKKNFLPPPKVNAAVVSFKVKRPENYPPVSSQKAFFSMVNAAFIGKRKMLRNSLQHFHTSEDIKRALTSLSLLETARPEELTLDQFLSLFNILTADSAR